MAIASTSFTLLKKRIYFATLLWFLLALIATIVQVFKKTGGINNYLIFKGVFWHTLAQTNLYNYYPAEYADVNHYGPVFGLLIAPFALLPNAAGCFLWCMANAVFLFYAVRRLPVGQHNQNIILIVGALEMMTSMHNVQFNPMLTSFIVFAYILVHNKKDFWATLFIAAGFLIKLYGIVGLAFFLFSSKKIEFALSFVFWMIVLFCLPMLLSSPAFILQSYTDWYHSLSEKNNSNQESAMQGMSAMRIIRKLCMIQGARDAYVIIPAALLSVLPALRFSQFKHKNFQLTYLALLLIAVVIFSSSAEGATFVIAMIGVGIWYVAQPVTSTWVKVLLAFAILLTSLSTTDFFPDIVKVKYIRPYALKALPCLIIWGVCCYQLLFKKFEISTLPNG